MSSSPFTGAKRLRELLKDPKKIVVCPGVFDGLTARIALSKGFDALYMVMRSSSGVPRPCMETTTLIYDVDADCPIFL